MAGIESKVIIEVGLNESQLKSANPNVPYSPQEIADEARRCYEAGAAVVHYHARDPLTFQTSTDLALNLETQRLISESTPLIAYPTYGDRIPVLGGHYEICSPARDRFAHIRSM
ncbi:MAG: 3-keto-5-aminohexanoate cleavage protein, partial [Vicinamibacterales bacterium]